MSDRLLPTIVGVLSLLLLLSVPCPSQAQDESGAEHNASHPAHGHHDNVIGFFVGGATEEAGSRENGLALGIEYERRLNQHFGIGAIAEHTYGELDVWIYAASFAFHTGPWRLYAAPGIEDTHHGSEKMLRLGVEYGIPVGRWEIAPQFDIDVVDREAEVLVLGITFARGFNF